MGKLRNGVAERSAAAVRAAEARGKVRTNPPVPHTPASSSSPEVGLGKVFHSFAEERKSAKSEATAKSMKFVPEHRDNERLLPRLRGAARR